MPWDPSPEAELWLQELAKDSGVTATWRGLAFVEQLAAKFPDVVDYYVNSCAARIREAQAEVLTLEDLDEWVAYAMACPDPAIQAETAGTHRARLPHQDDADTLNATFRNVTRLTTETNRNTVAESAKEAVATPLGK